MNPFLTEEGSGLIFEADLEKNFPWLKDYDLPYPITEPKPLIFKSYGRALDRFEALQGKPGSLLDVGCGSGHFLGLAKEKGWQVDGLDFDEASLRRAQEYFGVPTYQGTLETIELDREYDVITMWDYLEHVEKPYEIVQRAHSILKPKGLLMIACPNHRSLIFFAAILMKRLSFGKIQNHLPPLYPPTHLSYFNPSFVANFSDKIGFKLVSTEYDETDLSRVEISKVLKLLVGLGFGVARMLKLSNRFMVYLQKS